MATTRPPPADAAAVDARGLLPRITFLVCALMLALLAGCATRPAGRPSPGVDVGERIASHAVDEIGRRYRFGGDSPSGFDCSGLASYVHAREGFSLPRTAAEQFAAAPRIATQDLRAGDLVFFRFGGRAVDHVGVYVGAGEFVHAPGAGSKVRRARLDVAAFARRYAGAARWWRDPVAQ